MNWKQILCACSLIGSLTIGANVALAKTVPMADWAIIEINTDYNSSFILQKAGYASKGYQFSNCNLGKNQGNQCYIKVELSKQSHVTLQFTKVSDNQSQCIAKLKMTNLGSGYQIEVAGARCEKDFLAVKATKPTHVLIVEADPKK